MSKYYYVSQDDLTSVANKIRSVAEISGGLIFPAQFIANIPTIPQLHAVSISLDGNTLSITNPSTNGDFATSFIIKGNGEILGTTTESSIDLTTIIPSAGEYTITVLASGTNFKNSVASNEITYTTASYSITTTVTNGYSTGSETIQFKGSATVTIIPNSGYNLPNTINVINAGSYEYDNDTGLVTLYNPGGDITITASCSAVVYSIATTVNYGSHSGDTTIAVGDNAHITIVPTAGYDYPSAVTVVNADHTYDSTTGEVTLTNPTGNVTVTATCIAKSYSITTTVTNGSYSGSTSIVTGGTATITISPSTGYTVPLSVSVTNASKDYDASTGVLTLSNPTDNVTVTAECAVITYNIVTEIENGSYTGATSIEAGSTATVTVVPNSGYTYPSDVTVSGATKSYDSTTGVITLSNPTGNVAIAGECEVQASLAAPTISLSGDILSIVDNDGNATQFDIYVDGTYKAAVDKTS